MQQAMEMPKKVVRKIPAKVDIAEEIKQAHRQLRVAAYCRVSTAQEEQLNSYDVQVRYYTEKIRSEPKWAFVGIFADRGLSGTSTKKRGEFNKMIKMCRCGKIDMIITKSISRFARNAADVLKYVRMLKEIGVDIFFEEQNIHSTQPGAEFYITIYGSIAQSESENISANVIWGKNQSAKEGKVPFQYKRFLGYRRGPDGKPEIDPEQAEVVKRIYASFLAGDSMTTIANSLTADGIPTPTGSGRWVPGTIQSIISNERYIGNALLQKKYTLDSLTHKRKNNHGERTQYLIENSHDGLIRESDYYKVQDMLNQRNKFRGLTEHKFTHKILCPGCGKHFWRMVSHGKNYWLCVKRASQYSKCRPYRFEETIIERTALNMMCKLYLYQDALIQPIHALLIEMEQKQTNGDAKLFELDRSIAALNDKSLTLQKLNTKGFISPEEYRIQSETLAAQRKRITAERNKKLHGLQSHSAIEKLEELQAILFSWPGMPTEFDIDQFDEVIEKIIPTADNKLTFRLHCGLELTEEIPS